MPKTKTSPSKDAAATRADLLEVFESDFTPLDPLGNQRLPQRAMPYRKASYYQGRCQAEDRAASQPRDHKSVPNVVEVLIPDKDEVPTKGDYE